MSCSLVYHATIQGCTTADFSAGQRCSNSCRNGIRAIEDQVNNACANVDISSNSVLGLAQQGVLILEACFLNDVTLPQTTSTTSSARQTSVPALATTTSSARTSQSVGSFTIIPTPTVQTTPIQSTATTTTNLTIAPPGLTSTTSKVSTSTLPTSTSFLSTTPEGVSTSSTSSTTAVATTPTSTAQGGQGRGGGSPFDTTSSCSKLAVNWPLCLPIGAALITWFM